jgi:hypothetical protein
LEAVPLGPLVVEELLAAPVAVEVPVLFEPLALEVTALLLATLPLPDAAFALEADVVPDAVLALDGAAGAPLVGADRLAVAADPPGAGDGCQPLPDCESLLTETVVWRPFWSMVVVFCPSSTRVTVSFPKFRTVTPAACAFAEMLGEPGDEVPVDEAAGAGADEPDTVVAVLALAPGALAGGVSLLTETLVWLPAWLMVVVFFPSSTWVMVSFPNFRTVTLGTGALAEEDDGVLAEDAAGAGVAEAEVAVAVAVGPDAVAVGLQVVARVGGADGSAPGVPAGEAAWAAPPEPPERLCRSCGRSLSASLRWPSAWSGWPVFRSAMPPSTSPTPFMLDGRIELATSLTSLPGSVTAEVMPETMLPSPMAFSFCFLG